MKIEKKHLDDIKRCYCASNICMNGENHILLASEDPDIACNMYSGKDFETKETVWTIRWLHVHHPHPQQREGIPGRSGVLSEGVPVFSQDRMGKVR